MAREITAISRCLVKSSVPIVEPLMGAAVGTLASTFFGSYINFLTLFRLGLTFLVHQFVSSS